MTGIPFYRVCAVTGRIDADIRSYKTVIADGNMCFIENGEVEVCEESFAYTDLFTIVTAERLIDEEIIVANMPQQPFQNLFHSLSL